MKKKYPFNDWSTQLEGTSEYEQFIDFVWEEARKRFGVDQDGDCPVNIVFIDRTKYQPMHYFPVPYPHKAKTEKEWDNIYDSVSSNASMAIQTMDQTLNYMRHMRLKQKKDPPI